MESVLFLSADRDQARRLFGCRDIESLRQAVDDVVQAAGDSVWEAGPAALVLHRLLTDGTLEPDAGEYPLNHAVLGGRVLGHETGFAVVVKRPDMAPHIAAGLERIKPESIEGTFQQLQATMPDAVAGVETSDVAAVLARLTSLFQSAAQAGHAVVLVRRSK